jgi:hypothetical protein
MFDYEKFIEKYTRHWNTSTQKSKIEFYEKFIKTLVSKNRPVWVIETGTMHTTLEQNAGSFTCIIADLLQNHIGGKLTTVDISSDAIEKCKKNTLEYSSVIEYITSDSVKYLKSLGTSVSSIDALFLDSYDLYVPDPELSEIHHLRELLAVYDFLNEEVMIGVDDNFIPGTEIYWNWMDDEGNVLSSQTFDTGNKVIGKGKLIDRFLLSEDWQKFENLHIGENNNFLFQKKAF